MKNIMLTLVIFMSSRAFSAPTPIPAAARSCVACHGSVGNPLAEVLPRIAGLPEAYIADELKAYKNKTRRNVDGLEFMTSEAKKLSDQDIADVAKFFSEQAPKIWPTPGDPLLIAKGKDIFENGIPKKEVVACNACHSADGTEIMGPQIARQYSFYLVRQMEAFKAGTRKNAQTMPALIKNLDSQSMWAIAYYLESL